MSTLITWGGQDADQFSLRLDAVVLEAHSLRAVVTDHPVEVGANITDHVRPEALRLQISGCVSNAPQFLPEDHVDGATEVNRQVEVNVPERHTTDKTDDGVKTELTIPGYSAKVNVRAFSSDFDRVRAVWATLRALWSAGTLVTVVSRLATYQNMAIENCDAPTDSSVGDALMFDLALKQVLFANTPETVEVKAGARQNKAKVTPTKPSADEEDEAEGTVLTYLKDRKP